MLTSVFFHDIKNNRNETRIRLKIADAITQKKGAFRSSVQRTLVRCLRATLFLPFYFLFICIDGASYFTSNQMNE
jgi:predicted patatin/cPLA2 family phospholipase